MYKIAVGSSDGVNVDLKFGEVKEFMIYQVEGTDYKLAEKREATDDVADEVANEAKKKEISECSTKGCNSDGCQGSGHGCSGPNDIIGKVELIGDCRSIVCKKIGFQAQKQFEKKAISVFDVECEVTQALDKIVAYYNKLDLKKK